MQRLDRDQGLVVVTAERHVVCRAGAGVKHGVGGEGAGGVNALGAQNIDRGGDDLDFLAAERALLAGVRIEPGKGEPRRFEPQIAAQAARGRTPLGDDQTDREQLSTTSCRTRECYYV